MWSIKVAILTAGSLCLVRLSDPSLAQSFRLGPDRVEVRPAPEVLPPELHPRVRDELRDRMFERQACEDGNTHACVRLGS